MKGYSKKYFCCSCGKRISPTLAKCPYCKTVQPIEDRADALRSPIVQIECEKCGCQTSFFYDDIYSRHTICTNCGKATSYDTTGKEPIPILPTKPTAECPYCHSTNTKKISTLSKVASVALFDVFAMGKVSKQWHCNNCKSDF